MAKLSAVPTYSFTWCGVGQPNDWKNASSLSCRLSSVVKELSATVVAEAHAAEASTTNKRIARRIVLVEFGVVSMIVSD
jgi:hypothetical protein